MEFITTGNRIAVENFDIGKIYTITWQTGNYKSLACTGKGTDFVMFQDQEPNLLFCLTMDSAISVSSIEEGGGGSGTNNYNELDNKPSINGFVLVGNKTGAELGLASQSDLEDYATNASVVAGLATKQDALSSSQLAAVNSGIDSTKVAQIGANTAAIGGKQDALSSSQLAAVNSGITSADVAQITTNKNNILTVADQTTQYNVCSANSWSMTGIGASPKQIIVPISTGTYRIIATVSRTDTSKAIQFRIGYTTEMSVGNRIDILPAVETENYISNEFTLTSPAVCVDFWANTPSDVTQFAIIPKAIYDAGFTNYQPYALGNTELTTKEQQNENNILSAYGGIIGKNVVKQNTVTFTGRNKEILCAPISGYITIYVGNCVSTDTDASTCALMIDYVDGGSSTIISINRGTSTVVQNINLGSHVAKNITIYSSDIYVHGGGDTATFTDIMICSQANYIADSSYQPYVMSNAEITAWILSQS